MTGKLRENFVAYTMRQFRSRKVAVVSAYVVIVLAFVAVFADFLANEKPLVCEYKGAIYFPAIKEYAVDLGLGSYPKVFSNVDWRNLQYDFVVWTPIPYLPQNQDTANTHSVGPLAHQHVPSAFWRHWLGTDELGRDVLAGMIHGTRTAFLVGIISMLLAALIGIIAGAFAGYFGDDRLKISRSRLIFNIIFFVLAIFYAFQIRSYVLSDALSQSVVSFILQFGLSVLIFMVVMALGNIVCIPFKRILYLNKKVPIPVDIIVSRLIEIMVSIPALFLILAILAVVTKPSLLLIMAVIGLTSWTGIARFIRAELLKVRRLEYIEAAHALGYSEFRTLLRHAIPNSLSPVITALAFGTASAILVESTLSFLGFSAGDSVTWGTLLSAARQNASAWWLAVFPGCAIFITVTAFNLIGEGLTDALNPKLRK
jgi:peptide/nickel transport system permease protein